jgi:Tol biopolymer transport system component
MRTIGRERARRASLVVFVASLVLGACGVLAGGKRTGDSPCPVSVVAVRDKHPAEQPAALQLPFRAGTNPTSIPGPDSLRLLADAPEGHPRVFIEDMRTGARDDVVGVWATRPMWSPDGRYIACETYPSQDQSHQLAVVDRRMRKRVVVEARVAADEYRWSPDSRWIAVEGVERGTNYVVLSVYDLALKRLRRIATTRALGSCGLSWSPDSKLLAFTKPTVVGEDETVLAADLWVASTSDWLRCRVRATQEEIESQPEWLSDATLLVKVVPSASPQAVGRELVLELRRWIRMSQ